MINKQMKKELHSIALKHKVSDVAAEIIVKTPFLFQKRKLDEGNLEEPTSFYHRFLGRFFIKESKLKRTLENIKNGRKK